MTDTIAIERTYPAPASEVWRLWTTKDGIESWWAPDGFTVEVQKLDLRPGGELLYTMTATAPAQVEFMQSVGMPLTNASRKTFTEVVESKRLAYDSLIDFVPGIPPYEHATVVELHETEDGVHVVMTVRPMHDQEWTQRLVAGRENELDNLAKLFG
jgi:uncharacterized protein YndB with AHSA1/START domain